MERILFVFFICLHTACTSDGQPVEDTVPARTDSVAPIINPSGKTVETRFPAPAGYVRLPADSTTFAAYLRRFPLLPDGSPVLLFNGRPKARQDVHAAVLDIDVGKRNLQQCADAVMRLRAEYLFAQKRYAAIHFNFSNGFRADYARWRLGERIRVDGSRVSWVGGGATSGSYSSFRAYLDMVFAYAGSASLEREMRSVEPAQLRAGDVWIKGGYPGHAVIVMDVAVHPDSGETLFLLAQSYMPAQQIHVLRNPAAGESPWYSSLTLQDGLQTPEWFFEPGHLRRVAD
ncbi:MAG: DUF4846 domain-containing protein [Saprospiraceae bacterium]